MLSDSLGIRSSQNANGFGSEYTRSKPELEFYSTQGNYFGTESTPRRQEHALALRLAVCVLM
jgi:hypothetical protein